MAWGAVAGVIGPLAGGLIVDQLDLALGVRAQHPGGRRDPAADLGPECRNRRTSRTAASTTSARACARSASAASCSRSSSSRTTAGAPTTLGPLAGGLVALAAFVLYERRAAQPMLKLDLFTRRNFAIGNLQTLTMYGGLAILFFFLVIYLQQVAGLLGAEERARDAARRP